MPTTARRCLGILPILAVTLLPGASELAFSLEPALQPPKAAPRIDALGDPLPAGAVARLGMQRFQITSLHQPPISLPGAKAYLVFEPGVIANGQRGRYRWMDASTGKTSAVWPIPQRLEAVGVSADGKWALLANWGHFTRPVAPTDSFTLHLFDLAAKKEIRQFTGKFEHGNTKDGWRFSACLFSTDGKLLATCERPLSSLGQRVRLWDTATGKQLWADPVAQEGAEYQLLGFTPRGDQLIIQGPVESYIAVVDTAQAKVVREFKPKPGLSLFQTTGLSPDGAVLLQGSDGATIRRWDMRSGQELPALKGHTTWAWHWAFSADGQTIVTASGRDSFALIRDWPIGNVRAKVDLGRGGVRHLFLSADGRTLNVLFTLETMLHRYDVDSGKALPTPTETHGSSVMGVAAAPDGSVVSLGLDRSLRSWDPISARQTHQVALPTWGYYFHFALSASGKLAAVNPYERGEVLIVDRFSGKPTQTIRVDHQRQVTGLLTFSPDERFLSDTVHVWAVANGKLLEQLRMGHDPSLRNVPTVVGAFSPNSAAFVAPIGGRFPERPRLEDAELQFWEVGSWKRRERLPLQSFQLGYSPDGRTLIMTPAMFWTAPVEKCGFEWERSTSKDGELVLTERADARFQRYAPMEDYPALFLTLCEIAPTPAEMLGFANRFGRLGPLPDELIQGPVAGTNLTASAESLAGWQIVLARLRFEVELWQAIVAGNDEELKKFIYWEREEAVYFRGPANAKLPSTLDRFEIISLRQNTEQFCRLVVGDVRRPALLVLHRLLGFQLRNQLRINLRWDANADRDQLEFEPASLLGAIHLQFAQAVVESKQFRKCPACEKFFEIGRGRSRGAGRTDKQACSPVCRLRGFRHKQVRAKGLYAQRVPIKQIAKLIKEDEATVKSWVEPKKK